MAKRAAQVVADGIVEIGVVQDVEEVGAKRELDSFGQRERLLQVQGCVAIAGSAKVIPGGGVEARRRGERARAEIGR